MPDTDPLEICETAARAAGRVLADWRGRFTATSKGPRDLVTEADHAAQREVRGIVLGAFPQHGFVGEETDAGSPAAAPGQPGHSGSGLRWIVDPLDGTTNSVHGFPAYCVSVALADGAELVVATIYDPLRDECFTARRGGGAFLNGTRIGPPLVTDPDQAVAAVSFPAHVTLDCQAVRDFLAVLPHVQAIRRTGSTALNLAYLACGRLHAFWVRRIACWDVAAGALIAREAGCALGGFAGTGDALDLDRPGFIVASTPELLAALRTTMG
ncbi:MAG: inositol monophosphatase family protein [Planctomycetota bacterium]